MSHQIKIPPVGESVVSALVARWHIADGASIEKGQVLVTLETDKISNELEAEVAGKISITIHEGEEVEIGTVIGLIDQAAVREVVPASELAPSPPEKSAAETLGSEGEKVNITVPSAGESITSATVAVWAVSNNDYVGEGSASCLAGYRQGLERAGSREFLGSLLSKWPEGTEVSIGEKLGSIEVSAGPGPISRLRLHRPG